MAQEIKQKRGRVASSEEFPYMKKKMPPKFRAEENERKFVAAADSTEYIDWSQARSKRLVNLKPSLRTISLRLPVSMIEDLKTLANQRDVPYQSLLKVFLAERLRQERRGSTRNDLPAQSGERFVRQRVSLTKRSRS